MNWEELTKNVYVMIKWSVYELFGRIYYWSIMNKFADKFILFLSENK
jgi:hypothetical protein